MVSCPQCDSNIDAEEDELDEGDVITCDECGATLNVLGLDPLELEVEADDDDDEDEDDDGFVDDEEEEEEDGDDEEEEEDEDDDEDW